MFKLNETLKTDEAGWTFDFEFWPKQALDYYVRGEFNQAISLCEQNLSNEPEYLSGRIVYAKTLLAVERFDDASDQLYQILSKDPDNLMALKLLGDIYNIKDDFVSAFANYSRVLEIDPLCGGLYCEFEPKSEDTHIALTLVKEPEPEIVPVAVVETASENLIIETPELETPTIGEPERVAIAESFKIPEHEGRIERNPFVTETVADLYIEQGQPKLAIEILRQLQNGSHDSRIADKISAAERMIGQKERRDVEQSN